MKTVYYVSAAAAVKLLQSCPTLCNSIDGSLPGSSVPGILQTRLLEWVAISFSNAWKWKVKVKSLNHVRILRLHRLQPTRLLHQWDFPGKSTGVGSQCLLHPLCICTAIPYPFVCQWTSRLFPFPSYCKQCCNEYWGTWISLSSDFLNVYAHQWYYWVLWQFYFQFSKESPHCSL